MFIFFFQVSPFGQKVERVAYHKLVSIFNIRSTLKTILYKQAEYICVLSLILLFFFELITTQHLQLFEWVTQLLSLLSISNTFSSHKPSPNVPMQVDVRPFM